MVSILALWLPILLSAVVVFILSSFIHMVLPYHKSDFKKLPSEDEVMNALGKFNIPPGDYAFPFSTDSKERKSQEFKDKMNKGPVGFLTAFPNGQFGMGSSLIKWFLYCIVVEMFAAYIAGHALNPASRYIAVLKFSGVTAFIGFGLALIQDRIWYRKSWGTTLKNLIDAVIYGLATALIFGWLWP